MDTLQQSCRNVVYSVSDDMFRFNGYNEDIEIFSNNFIWKVDEAYILEIDSN